MRTFDLLQPTTLDEAVQLSAHHGDEARFVAGGAMLMILLRQRIVEPRYLIDLSGVPQLSGVALAADGLRLGAMTTIRAIERAPRFGEPFPVLAEAAHLVGNVRVRNVATIGGHLAQADVHLDLPPVLLALGASVEVRGHEGLRHLPLERFLVGYYETALGDGELLVSVNLPTAPPGLRGVYLKYCSLSPNDWPTVGVAAFLQADDGRATDVRIVVGSVSDRPLRINAAEALLERERLSSRSIAEVGRRYAAAADPLSDVRGSAEYKRRMTDVFVQRAIAQAGVRAGLSLDA